MSKVAVAIEKRICVKPDVAVLQQAHEDSRLLVCHPFETYPWISWRKRNEQEIREKMAKKGLLNTEESDSEEEDDKRNAYEADVENAFEASTEAGPSQQDGHGGLDADIDFIKSFLS